MYTPRYAAPTLQELHDLMPELIADQLITYSDSGNITRSIPLPGCKYCIAGFMLHALGLTDQEIVDIEVKIADGDDPVWEILIQQLAGDYGIPMEALHMWQETNDSELTPSDRQEAVRSCIRDYLFYGEY
jgi:hypothetical protein